MDEARLRVIPPANHRLGRTPNLVHSQACISPIFNIEPMLYKHGQQSYANSMAVELYCMALHKSRFSIMDDAALLS